MILQSLHDGKVAESIIVGVGENPTRSHDVYLNVLLMIT